MNNNSRKKIFLPLIGILLFSAIILFEMKKESRIDWLLLDDGTYQVENIILKKNVESYSIPNKHLFREVSRVKRVSQFIDDRDRRRTFRLKSISIPNSIKYIGDFSSNEELETIIGGTNVEYIEDYAFVGLDKLKSIPTFDNLKYIGERSFFRCNLEDVHIASSVQRIEKNAFLETPWMKKQAGFLIVGDSIVLSYPNDEIVFIPDKVRSICLSVDMTSNDDNGVFFNKIKKIYIPDSLVDMNDYFNVWGGEDDDTIEIYIYASLGSKGSVDRIMSEKKDNDFIKKREKKYLYIVEKGSDVEKFFNEINYGNLKVVDEVKWPQ